VPVLCRKGFEVSFKIPGGVGIYLQPRQAFASRHRRRRQ
jgi:hypothetical protein